jgi:cytochrome subunit of sulfide dehydrogenase
MQTLRLLPPLLTALSAISAITAAGTAHAQTAAELNTRALAATCASCHGTDGKAVPGEAMVPLVGLPPGHIAAQMKAFRDGTRPATVMHQIAKGYTPEQVDAIAAYFANKK